MREHQTFPFDINGLLYTELKISSRKFITQRKVLKIDLSIAC